MFDLIARVLSGFYALPVVGGSYGLAIIGLTLAVMVVLMPLTLRATRSTIKMQMVQPELQRIQKKHKGDKERMNAELMTLYQEQGINPVGGCIPVLAQLPVFLVLFRVIRGLTRRLDDSPFFELANEVRARTGNPPLNGDQFNPRFLATDSQMYKDLLGETEMGFLGGALDLGRQANEVLASSILDSIPYLILIAFVVGTSYYQQRQISARRDNKDEPLSAMMQQQQMLLKFLPIMSGFWSFFFPVGLVLYWATSNLFRIGQQAYITRAIYGKKDEMEAQLKAKAEERKKNPAKKPLGQRMLEQRDAAEAAASEPKSQKDNGSANGSVGDDDASDKIAARRKAEQARRARHQAKAKSKKKAQESPSSSRVTPKGTKPGSTNQGAKKRKR